MSAVEEPMVADWRGHLLAVGDTVIYPRMSGYSVEAREAVVLEIVRHETDRRTWPNGFAGDPVSVPQFKFKLQPSGRSSRGFYSGEKPVWIQNGENVTRA